MNELMSGYPYSSRQQARSQPTRDSYKAVIQILPAYVCRNEDERDTTMLAVKEETLEAAFKELCNALDSLIGELVYCNTTLGG